MLTTNCNKNFIVCFTSVVNSMNIAAKETLSDVLPVNNMVYFENDCLMPYNLIDECVNNFYENKKESIPEDVIEYLE